MWNIQQLEIEHQKYPNDTRVITKVYELIDISSANEDEELREGASISLPKCMQSNYRVVLEFSNTSVEALVGERPLNVKPQLTEATPTRAGSQAREAWKSC